jgi:2,4-dienoyl-CoA reductase-like NADH-dependent reductase (Old Yellow Enzyme family)
MSVQPLFTPVRMGDLDLPHRIVMAPLTRMGAGSIDQRPYIANPDLVERLATGAPLAEVDWKTVYASGPRGYTDYPAIRWAAAE